ncbi:MAG: cation-translocating P-type ATPase [Selenomonadaceae bacterium]|nr:cation-translocating P-type ATPase [Selenomonadaceae bacterium]
MTKIFFLLEVLATSIVTVNTFFLRGEEAAIAAGLTVFIAAVPICLWLSKFLVIQFTKRVLKSSGIAVQNSRAIQLLSEVNTVATPLNEFVTTGKFSVTDIIPEGGTDLMLLSYAASVEQDATHELGRAIYKEALGRRLKIQRVAAFSEIPCCGVEAVINDVPVRVGTAEWIKSRGVSVSGLIYDKVRKLAEEGKTPLVVSIGNVSRGIIALKDEVNPEMKSFFSILKRNELETAVLTATNELTAKNLAQRLSVDVLRAALQPEDKAREVQILRAKKQVVAVLGSEQRDMPSLFAGDVSVFLSDKFAEEENKFDGGDEVDFKISEPDKFFTLREIALYAVKLIKINRWVSVLAWLALVGAALTTLLDEPPFPFSPEFAAAGVSATVVLVFMNSMRMLNLRH